MSLERDLAIESLLREDPEYQKRLENSQRIRNIAEEAAVAVVGALNPQDVINVFESKRLFKGIVDYVTGRFIGDSFDKNKFVGAFSDKLSYQIYLKMEVISEEFASQKLANILQSHSSFTPSSQGDS